MALPRKGKPRPILADGVFVRKQKGDEDNLLTFDIHVERFIKFLRENHTEQYRPRIGLLKVLTFDVNINQYGRMVCQVDPSRLTYQDGDLVKVKHISKWQRNKES